ncbi:acyl-CoA dehydrogenase [Streptomyces longisporoflavus]|uniref:acyl-CoA dehydrogenase family protein n=1 Tax=Streptomyces longisporoflavus TaxID=28044 RepID=UPI00167D794A|nr:acyl-CoA dehydrogenase family protein [Streptomyces longisporoflavus]GGV71903.1 acyl-CoA dehydrogenase [Streptomyces longisporoflavus]
MEPQDLEILRQFVNNKLGGDDTRLDSLSEKPLQLYEDFRATGLANWWLPEESGGRGFSLEDGVEIVNEIAYGDAGVAFTLLVSILGSSVVRLYGSDDLKDRYLKPMAAGGTSCAALGSEREAGSELNRIGTVAARSGNDLVLTGEKFFATNAEFADFLLVIAKAADDPDEYLAVVVPGDAPGVEIVKRWDVIGLRASYTYSVKLDNCRVPAANQLSGSGLRVLETGLNASRTLIAASAIGIARRIRDHCMTYAKEKQFRGGTLLESPVLAQKLGQMEMQIDVMKSHCLKAAREYDEIMAGPDAAKVFSRKGTLKSALTAKLFCGQAGWSIASAGSEMFGGLGYTNELPIGKLLRDMRYVSIVEGGDDVLRELLFSRYVIPVSRRT